MIRINDDYFVIVEDNNYALCIDYHTTKKSKDGSTTPSFKKIGFYNGLDGAIKRCAEETSRERLKDVDVTLTEACEIIRNCYKEFGDILKSSIPTKVDY